MYISIQLDKRIIEEKSWLEQLKQACEGLGTIFSRSCVVVNSPYSENNGCLIVKLLACFIFLIISMMILLALFASQSIFYIHPVA